VTAAVVAFLFLDSVLYASPATATFDEKVDNAAAIFVGRCTAHRSRWDAAHRWIITDITFLVEKTLKGFLPPEITLILPDGDVGGMHQRTVGIPIFVRGRDYVVFVKNTAVGPTVLYFSQGVYDVTADDRGFRIVTPPPSDEVRIDKQRGLAVDSEQPRSVSDFERAIQMALRDAGSKMTMSYVEVKRSPTTFGAFVMRNAALLGLALLGGVIAVWQFLRRK
jgi:hypothetical protein